MSTTNQTSPATGTSDFQVARRLEIERRRLRREAGLPESDSRPYQLPGERDFTRAERDQVTLLFGGLTRRHDRLIRAATRNLGYCVEVIDTPTKADFQTGRALGNNGQCNPTHFTAGALVNHLDRLRAGGLSAAEIIDRFVYVTAGACGPCRFGMYEAEYRLALRNAGYEGFRVVLFQQRGGLKQSESDFGIDLNIDFALALLNAIAIADVLNELACLIRPYETTPGRTDAVFERATALVEGRLLARGAASRRPPWWARWLAWMTSPLGRRGDVAKILGQLACTHYTGALQECRDMIDEDIEVDFTRVKPICKITGEFWAQTTEGDGNYRMFDFLEEQGAEVLPEPITTWVSYMIAQELSKRRDRKGLGPEGRRWANLRFCRDRVRFGIAARMLDREYNRVRQALGGTTHPQVCQWELQRLGHPYYHRKSGGGEGHLEVAKNIYYGTRGLAHMVMSLKPFGCLPSSQSDGAQAAVVAHYPDLVFIPIETSGEGDVNAYSRAQMALCDARARCQAEFDDALAASGLSLADLRALRGKRRDLRRPLQRLPRPEGVAGTAARFVAHVRGRRSP